MRGALLSLFLLGLPALALCWDHFQFDITFFCNYIDRKDYNLKIEWWEKDSVSKGELITSPKLLRPSIGRFSFTMPGAMNGDEMFSAGYHPVAYISHDCTDDKKRVDYVLDVTRLCEIGNPCHYRIVKDITNTWGKDELSDAEITYNWDSYPNFP